MLSSSLSLLLLVFSVCFVNVIVLVTSLFLFSFVAVAAAIPNHCRECHCRCCWTWWCCCCGYRGKPRTATTSDSPAAEAKGIVQMFKLPPPAAPADRPARQTTGCRFRKATREMMTHMLYLYVHTQTNLYTLCIYCV